MPGNNRAVFLDRDGTIVEDPGYLAAPEQLRLLGGAADAIATLRERGFLVILATNQSAIARGTLTEEGLADIHRRLAELLAEANPAAGLDGIYFCPYHPEAVVSAYRQESYLRKPRPGMLFKAARERQLDLGSCWMVGDSERDVQAGKAAGCRTVRIHADPETETAADHVLGSLAQAAEVILASPGRAPLRPAGREQVEPPRPPPVEQQASPPVAESPHEAVAQPAAEPAEQAAAQTTEPASPVVRETPPAPAMAETTPADQPAEPVPTEGAPLPAEAPSSADQPAAAAPAVSQSAQSSPAETHPGRPKATAPEHLTIEPIRTLRPLGETRKRLLEELAQERRGRGPSTSPQPPPDSPKAGQPPHTKPAVETKTVTERAKATAEPPAARDRPLEASNMRHVLAEILQQLRQLNRGPEKNEITVTKIIGGLLQAVSWALLAIAVTAFLGNRPINAIVWGVLATFVQVASLAFFLMQREE